MRLRLQLFVAWIIRLHLPPTQRLSMNTASVEIQRIQTRLQQLGRPRQATTSDLHSDSDANSGSSSYLDLPQASHASNHQASHLSRPSASEDVTHIGVNSTLSENAYVANPPAAQTSQAGNTIQESSTFSNYSLSMPRSEIATQARSVHMNEDTMTVLRSSALPLDRRDRPAVDNSSEQYTNRQRAVEQHNTHYYSVDCHVAQTKLPPQQYSYQEQQGSATVAPSYSHPFFDSNQPSYLRQTQTNPSVSHAATPKTLIQEPTIPTPAPSHQADPWIEIFQHLNAQAQQVNLIANTLKVALQEMGTIAQQAERQRSLASVKGHHMSFTAPASSLVCDVQSLTIPQIEQQIDGAFVIKALPIGDIVQNYQVEHLAQQLRDKASHRPSKGKARNGQGVLSGLIYWMLGLNASPSANQSHIRAAHHAPGSETPTMIQEASTTTTTSNLPPNANVTAQYPPSPPLISSIIWVGGSIIVRIGLPFIVQPLILNQAFYWGVDCFSL